MGQENQLFLRFHKQVTSLSSLSLSHILLTIFEQPIHDGYSYYYGYGLFLIYLLIEYQYQYYNNNTTTTTTNRSSVGWTIGMISLWSK